MKVHGIVSYICCKCDRVRRFYCEDGVVKNVDLTGPIVLQPVQVRCKHCRGDMRDASGYMKFDCVPFPAIGGMDVLHRADGRAVPGIIGPLGSFISDVAYEEGRQVVTSL